MQHTPACISRKKNFKSLKEAERKSAISSEKVFVSTCACVCCVWQQGLAEDVAVGVCVCGCHLTTLKLNSVIREQCGPLGLPDTLTHTHNVLHHTGKTPFFSSLFLCKNKITVYLQHQAQTVNLSVCLSPSSLSLSAAFSLAHKSTYKQKHKH